MFSSQASTSSTATQSTLLGYSRKRPASSFPSSSLGFPPAAQRQRVSTQQADSSAPNGDQEMGEEKLEWAELMDEALNEWEDRGEPATSTLGALAPRTLAAVEAALKEYRALVKALNGAETSVASMEKFSGEEDGLKGLPKSFAALANAPAPHHSPLFTKPEIVKDFEDRFRKELREVIVRNAARYLELRRTEVRTGTAQLSEGSLFSRFYTDLKGQFETSASASGNDWFYYRRALKFAMASLYTKISEERLAASEALAQKQEEASRKAEKVSTAKTGASSSSEVLKQETIAELVAKELKQHLTQLRKSFQPPPSTPSATPSGKGKNKKGSQNGKKPAGGQPSQGGQQKKAKDAPKSAKKGGKK